jgi:hypothetical protein
MDDNIKLIITELEPEKPIVSQASPIVKQKTREQPILVRPTQSKPAQRPRRMGLVFN